MLENVGMAVDQIQPDCRSFCALCWLSAAAGYVWYENEPNIGVVGVCRILEFSMHNVHINSKFILHLHWNGMFKF
jgi:hypothetical protein